MDDKNLNLYRECFEASENQSLIQLSHPPFQNGYYITEYGVILMVKKPNIYCLEDDGWNPAQHYFSLWYDSMVDFSDIPSPIAERLGLGEYKIQPCK